MTSINPATDVIAGVDTRLVRLPATLRLAGIDAPQKLTDGLTVARWTLPAPDVATAEKAVLGAGTEEEYHAAVTALANHYLTANAIGTSTVRNVADRRRVGAAWDAFRETHREILALVIESYNARIPDFQDELTRLPDLRGRGIYDLSAEDASALATAKETAEHLSNLLNAYQDLARLAGYPEVGSAKDVGGAMTLLSTIGEFASGQALENAATDLVRYQNGEGNHGKLQPHAVAAWQASEYRMVDPDDAAERRAIAVLSWDGSNASI